MMNIETKHKLAAEWIDTKDELQGLRDVISIGLIDKEKAADLLVKEGLGDKIEDELLLSIGAGIEKSFGIDVVASIKKLREELDVLEDVVAHPTDTIPDATSAAGAETIDAIEKRNDTTLGDELGNFLQQYGPAKTGKENSCGMGVGMLLTAFGIQGLPTSGRDGHKWDDGNFLEKVSGLTHNGRPLKFVKVPIDSPYKARPGAIVVYDKKAQLGTDDRKKYGHVEIVGPDKQFYSYYDSPRAAGSSKPGKNVAEDKILADKKPKEYKSKTGFTGYAYYPVLEDQYDDAIAMIDQSDDGLLGDVV